MEKVCDLTFFLDVKKEMIAKQKGRVDDLKKQIKKEKELGDKYQDKISEGKEKLGAL